MISHFVAIAVLASGFLLRQMPVPPDVQSSPASIGASGGMQRDAKSEEPNWDISTASGLDAFASAVEAASIGQIGHTILKGTPWISKVPKVGSDSSLALIIRTVARSPQYKWYTMSMILRWVQDAPINASTRRQLLVDVLIARNSDFEIVGLPLVDELEQSHLDALWNARGGGGDWPTIRVSAVLALALRGDPRAQPWAEAKLAETLTQKPSGTGEGGVVRLAKWEVCVSSLRLSTRLAGYAADPRSAIQSFVDMTDPFADARMPHAMSITHWLVRRGMPRTTVESIVRERLDAIVSGTYSRPESPPVSAAEMTRMYAATVKRFGMALGVIGDRDYPTIYSP